MSKLKRHLYVYSRHVYAKDAFEDYADFLLDTRTPFCARNASLELRIADTLLLKFTSCSDPNSYRGRSFDRVIVDELVSKEQAFYLGLRER